MEGGKKKHDATAALPNAITPDILDLNHTIPAFSFSFHLIIHIIFIESYSEIIQNLDLSQQYSHISLQITKHKL